MKEIDLIKNLFEITEEYPELIPVLAEVGFAGVTNEAMRTTHAKVMTIPKGCEDLGLNLDDVVAVLEAQGYTVKR